MLSALARMHHATIQTIYKRCAARSSTLRHCGSTPDESGRSRASFQHCDGGVTVKLALAIGYSGGHMALPVARVQRAEALGYHSVWSADAYGSDALSPHAYLAGVTQRIKLGSGIIQLAARTAANAAMTAARTARVRLNISTAVGR